MSSPQKAQKPLLTERRKGGTVCRHTSSSRVCSILLQRWRVFYKSKARPSTSQKLATRCIAILSFVGVVWDQTRSIGSVLALGLCSGRFGQEGGFPGGYKRNVGVRGHRPSLRLRVSTVLHCELENCPCAGRGGRYAGRQSGEYP